MAGGAGGGWGGWYLVRCQGVEKLRVVRDGLKLVSVSVRVDSQQLLAVRAESDLLHIVTVDLVWVGRWLGVGWVGGCDGNYVSSRRMG